LPVPEIESIKIIRTPGHTPEHVCYVYQDFLFAGDLICTEDNSFSLLPDKYVFNKLQNIDSIKSLRVNNINWVCPAHGEPIRSSKN
jgi:glyoxylase-like metal-dependent hydrolase (beta-lactamase superfamily II)